VTTALAESARTARRGGGDRRSLEARRLFDNLMAVSPEVRRGWIRGLPKAELVQVFAAAQQIGGSPYVLYRDDALGFVEDVLAENVWSKSREILESLTTHSLVAIPSCFSSSKSWTLSRAALWFSNVHAVGTARVVTLAPQWRQVSGIMWGAEIRGAHARAKLPGVVGDVQLKMPTGDGVMLRVAEGIVGNPRNEASTQGLHAPHVLVLVDEAGGIPWGVGNNLRALLTSEGTQMVAIGNPPSDDEGTWFEDLCSRDDVKTIRISAYDTPNLTGEPVRRCKSCPPAAPRHSVAKHLVRRKFVEEVKREFGADSPYFQAKVEARFPKGGSRRMIPSLWADAAVDAVEPVGASGYVRLCDLGLKEETGTWLAQRGAWIRLGVDVAADGGDELVISRCVGDLVTIQHISSGPVNENAFDVAGVILEEIKKAQQLRHELGTRAPVRVKVDAIGVGWGVVSTLKRWADEGRHDAIIVGVNVSKKTDRIPDGSPMVPERQRDEMWIATRELLRPDEMGDSMMRLRVDRKTVAQLTTPTYGTTSQGKTKVESKAEVKKRIPSSPDRAEAVLLALYEPPMEDDLRQPEDSTLLV
jgi:hypothetical protein